MVLGDRRRRSVIVKLVELAIALVVLLAPASALALTRASVSENVTGLVALSAKTRVRGFEQGATKNASACTPTSTQNASGKSECAGQDRVRVHHSNRQWSPELGAFLSADEFEYFATSGTLWSWPNQNPIAFDDPSGNDGGATALITWVVAGGTKAVAGGVVAAAAAPALIGAAAAASLYVGTSLIDAHFAGEAEAQSAAAIATALAGAEAANMAVRKGERGRTAKPGGTPNPTKKFRWNKKRQRWEFEDPQTGKWKLKPPDFKPSPGPIIPWSEDETKCE